MAGIGPRKMCRDFMVPASLSASLEAVLWNNNDPDSMDWRVAGVDFLWGTAITGHTTNYLTVAVHHVTTAQDHATVVATKSFTSGVNHTAFDESALTLTAANAIVEENEGLNAVFTMVGTETGYAYARLVVTMVEGEGTVQ